MAKTFCSTPLTFPAHHAVATERGHYLMSAFWIDTAQPSDMMDYDFTRSWRELLADHAASHSMWCEAQAGRG